MPPRTTKQRITAKLSAVRAWLTENLSIDWVIAVALCALIAVIAAKVPALEPRFETIVVCAIALLVLAPLFCAQWAARFMRRAQRRPALLFATMAFVLHPSKSNRFRAKLYRTLLDLRAGREPSKRERHALTEGDAAFEEELELLALSARGDVRGVYQALESPENRTHFYRAALGLAHLRAVALLDPSAESLVRCVTEITALDPSMQHSERRALLAAFALAYAGDQEGAIAATSTLREYLAPSEAETITAMARFCAGDREAAERELAAAITKYSANSVIVHSLGVTQRTLREAPARTRSLHSEALADMIARLRGEVRELAVIAPFDGRASTPWLTLAWTALLLVVFVATSLKGAPFTAASLERLGALATSSIATLSDLRHAWPRLFTHGLLHAGSLHLALNLLALWSFGPFCEAYYGRFRTAALYLTASALSGAAVVYGSDPLRPTVLVGASGSIFALGGAIIAAIVVDRELRATERGRWQLVALVVAFAVQSVLDRVIPGISGAAHLAGIAAGALLGALLVMTRRR